jgi:hypothetical protein
MNKMINIIIIAILAMLLFASIPFIFGGLEGGMDAYGFIFKALTVNRPQKPKITYGEFPFTLVYEINGEERIIKDTLICEYDGVQWVGDFVYGHNSWKESLKSGNERIVLLQIDETSVIYYPIADLAYYYMGDGAVRDTGCYQNAVITHFGKGANQVIDAEELFNKYSIRILDWEIAPPITNSFK